MQLPIGKFCGTRPVTDDLFNKKVSIKFNKLKLWNWKSGQIEKTKEIGIKIINKQVNDQANRFKKL